MKDITGQIHVSVSTKAECYGGRRIHLRIDGLPGWLLGLLTDAGTFKLEASSYRSDREDGPGPNSVLLGSERVVTMAEPTYLALPSEGEAQ